MAEWLMLTTVGQLFVRTKLFGLTTTVFVRRMIVLYVPLALVAIFAGPFQMPWYARLLLVLPTAVGFLIAFGIVFALVWRVIAFMVPGFGSLFVGIADMIWRIEAGNRLADEQDRATEGMVANAQLREAQGEVAGNALLGELAVAKSIVVGGKAYTKARVHQGELRGYDGPNEVVLGKVKQTGMDVYEVKDATGKTLLRFDDRGEGRDGKLVVRPTDMSDDEWRAVAHGSPAPAPSPARARRGPLLQSGALAAVTAASYFVATTAIDDADVRFAPGGTDLASANETTLASDDLPPHDPGEVETMLADDEGEQREDEMQGDMGADLHAGAVAGGVLDAPCPLASARASRELITQRAGQYPASKAIDGTSETAWAVTNAIPGEDWIEVSLTAPMTVTRVAFTPGWDRISPRGIDLFVANARVRRATIVTDAGRRTVDAASDERMKEVRLDHETSRVRLVIDEVWPGERWQDLSVGEITLYCAR